MYLHMKSSKIGEDRTIIRLSKCHNFSSFENFEGKVEIGHFGFWHPYGFPIGVPKAKVTDLNFFLKIFKIMLKTCSYMC